MLLSCYIGIGPGANANGVVVARNADAYYGLPWTPFKPRDASRSLKGHDAEKPTVANRLEEHDITRIW